MTQYRIVQRTSEYSVTTFVIQKNRWFKWKDVRYKCSNEIVEYRNLIEAKKRLERLCFIPPKDLVVYIKIKG